METKTASTGTIRYWAAARGAAGTAEESYRAGALADRADEQGGAARRVVTEYPVHLVEPSAEAEPRRVAEEIAAQFPVRAPAAVHRTGPLAIGDVAVITAVSCPHRAEAFAACRKLIDTLKHEVPVWKRQIFTDGATEWVGAC
ncbi:molybdenum cofactor biosynthesis protein MoaE [Streptomyces griseoluteus]|uniref:molybdenum cofactor biosynthesis protein MoaE n=1 Tax=Streptomyces griseoluteus TaxID=29306 RepID=UPI0036492FB8